MAGRRRASVSPLTPRQTDLLRLVADGHTNGQIARRLGLSEGTVRTHLENIYGRLQVSSRTAAVLRVGEPGLESLKIDRLADNAGGVVSETLIEVRHQRHLYRHW